MARGDTTLADLGFLKIIDKKFKGKAPIFYNPKLPLNVSYTRLVKDMEKDAIIWTLPKVIEATERVSSDSVINMIVGNMSTLILNNATKTDAPIKSITRFFNKNILDAKIQVAKIERDVINDTLKIFEISTKSMKAELDGIKKELKTIINSNIDPTDKKVLTDRLKFKQKAINARLEKMKQIAGNMEKQFNAKIAQGVIRSQKVAYNKVAKTLSNYPVTNTIYSGLPESFIMSLLPNISEKEILHLLANRFPIGVGISDGISRQMRNQIAKTTLVKGKNVFITARELDAQFASHLKGVFNSTAYRANMMARTTVIYAENMTTYELSKEMGCQKFIVIGSEASPPCPTCPPIWGEIFDMINDKDKIPPLHPNCRCAMSPFVSDKYPIKEADIDDDFLEQIYAEKNLI